MKEKTLQLITSVTSEPGDATHYEYLVYRDGPYSFTFAPTRSTFRFPQRISAWDIPTKIDLNNDESQMVIRDVAERERCNPYTVAECMRTMRELLKEDEYER